jgi:hypothetical protein
MTEAEKHRQAAKKSKERKGRQNRTGYAATPARSDSGAAQQSAKASVVEVSPADASKHFEQSLRSPDRKEQKERRKRELLAQKAALEAKIAARKQRREDVPILSTATQQSDPVPEVQSEQLTHIETNAYVDAQAGEETARFDDGRVEEKLQLMPAHTTVDEKERRFTMQEAERARKRAIYEQAIRRVEEAEQQREKAERAGAPNSLDLALHDSTNVDGEALSPTSVMSAESSLSEAGMVAANVTAQICNTAKVSAMSAIVATACTSAELADLHANGRTSPRLPPDNGTGYSPRHREGRGVTSTSADVATASFATEEQQ